MSILPTLLPVDLKPTASYESHVTHIKVEISRLKCHYSKCSIFVIDSSKVTIKTENTPKNCANVADGS